MTWIALNRAKISYCMTLVDTIQMDHNHNSNHHYKKNPKVYLIILDFVSNKLKT